MSTNSESQMDEVPLCVDLDGSLVNTDTLLESALLLAKSNLFYIFFMIYWLWAGKANLKAQIAARTQMDVAILPYNQKLIAWLQTQREAGRQLILVTAANQKYAQAISEHLQLFSQVLASSSTHNLGAANKRDELDRVFGMGRYDYVGNSADDVVVWEHSRRAILVNASPTLTTSARQRFEVEAEFPSPERPFMALFKAMRPHQWSKNLLVFVSILVAQRYTDSSLVMATIVAFVAFCLCSSAVYLVNDLLDLESDRKHSEKYNRPFANGSAPLLLGVVAAPLLLLVAVLLSLVAGGMFFNVLICYFVVTLAYSFYFKRVALLDVLILAMLYTLRIVAGASVADAMPSVWLVSFSLFIFTSLAMAKRYAELKSLEQDKDAQASGRGYHVSDLGIIAQLGATSGYISALVLALYIDSPDVISTYQNQHVMWLLCPLLMYWIGRIWVLASRGQLDQDPVVFAARDRVSYLIFLLGLVVLMVSVG